jgi:hypothetical protein
MPTSAEAVDNQVVKAAAERVQVDIPMSRVGPVGQQGYRDPPRGIDPQRGAGETGVAEAPRVKR